MPTDADRTPLYARWVLYPYLMAAFPILSLYSNNVGKVSGASILVPLGLALLLAVCAGIALRLLMKDAHKRGVVLGGSVTIFWSFQWILDLTRHIFGSDLSPYRLPALALAALCLVIFPFAARILDRSDFSCTTWTRVLNPAAFVMVIASCLWSGFVFLNLMKQDVSGEIVAEIPNTGDSGRPHILFLLLDTYGRGDVLMRQYHHDNTDFLGSLEDRGFTIVPNSLSSYNLTTASLASTLNMRILTDEAKGLGGDVPLEALIRDNLVFRQLRAWGWMFNTEIGIFTRQENDDIFDSNVKVNEFRTILSDATPLRLLLELFDRQNIIQNGRRSDVYDHHRDDIRYQLEFLKSLQFGESPYFMFAHIMSPHWPHVFDAQGGSVYPDTRYKTNLDFPSWEAPKPEVFVSGYANQVSGLNIMLLEALDSFCRNNPDALIVIQGDHGPRRSTLMEHSMELEQRSHEELPILNAWRFPEGSNEFTSIPNANSVNTFRVIFDHFFGTEMGIIEPTYFLFDTRIGGDAEEVTQWLQVSTP